MTRPTKERLEEIRDLAKKPERPVYRELLAEIDALEKERDEAIDLVYETCDFLDPRTKKSIHDLIKERDRLREALTAVKLDAIKCGDGYGPQQYFITQWAMDKINALNAQAARKCGLCIDGKPCNMEGCLNELT